MMRRRGGTNRLKQPKRDKKQPQQTAKYLKKKATAHFSGDFNEGSTSSPAADAAASPSEVSESHDPNVEVPGPSALMRQTENNFDFIFKRPKTPPPKGLKRTHVSPLTRLPESRRIRSKSKPGKTGFPIGASIHGLPRSEKLERRSKGKSRTKTGGVTETADNASTFIIPDRTAEPLFESSIDSTSGERQNGSPRLLLPPQDQVISYPRQTVTKLRFPPPRQRSASEKRSKRSDDSLNQQGVKESLEICQGFSRIKIEDWYPLFDYHHSKRNATVTEPNSSVATTVTNDGCAENTETSDANDDDEWEESLVYVDLEDIPDVDALFSSTAGRRRDEETYNDREERLSELEMKIYNLDSEMPVFLIGGKYLAGHWENTCGTSLFFKKKSNEEANHSPSGSREEKPGLKNIVPEPDIPYDPVFGKNYNSPEDGYELVAKSMKVLKARYFPAVNQELKGEDVIRDADDEFDHRDFQIPPVSMVREFLPSSLTYEKYVEDDIERRRKIRERWGKPDCADPLADVVVPTAPNDIVKSEPLDHDDDQWASDSDDLDSILILSGEENEPTPGPSRNVK